MQTTLEGLYAVGDCRRGPATVVKAIADAQLAAAAIAGAAYGISFEEAKEQLFEGCVSENTVKDMRASLAKKGALCSDTEASPDKRCLGCPTVCEVCVDVCPNRANVAIEVPGMEKPQILHVDRMCNECGNCAVFCPYSGRPYKDKFTLFGSFEDFENSENEGFLLTGDPKVTRVRLAGTVKDYDVTSAGSGLYEPLRQLIAAVREKYGYLI